jgi:hypothetical protein
VNQFATRIVDFVGRLQVVHAHTRRHASVRERGNNIIQINCFTLVTGNTPFRA